MPEPVFYDRDKPFPPCEPSEAANERGVCHTREECVELYAALTPELKQPVLELLREKLGNQIAIRGAIEMYGENWVSGYHHGWGTGVRNLLRVHGYGEQYFWVHNLDCIYVALVEEALKEKGEEKEEEAR